MKRIISRFEYILNTYLREFVRLSVTDWVDFIKSFTLPAYGRGELWKVQATPMIVIHLSFNMRSKKKEDKKKRSKNKQGQEESDKGGDDDSNKIQFHPRIEKCGEFLK